MADAEPKYVNLCAVMDPSRWGRNKIYGYPPAHARFFRILGEFLNPAIRPGSMIMADAKALTSAVMQRYHVYTACRRELGVKFGKLVAS
jgi:hypothetical protein